MTIQAMPDARCPHCGSSNSPGVSFCAACGKALPNLNSSGPLIVSGDQFASTASGQKLQADELHKQARKASGALLAVAIIQSLFLAFIFFMLIKAQGSAHMLVPPALVELGVIAAIFWGLYFWSRKSPFPAAIAGLVIY